MNQFPAECNYAQPDISIPHQWLGFNQAGLRSWTEEGILWESSSPLELPLFWECLQILWKPLLCFPMPCEAGHQVTLDQKVPRSARDISQRIPALPRSSLSICMLTLPEHSSSDHLGTGSPTEEQEPPQRTGQTRTAAGRQRKHCRWGENNWQISGKSDFNGRAKQNMEWTKGKLRSTTTYYFLKYLNKSIITIPISALNYFFCSRKTRIHRLKSGRYLQNGFRIALRVFLASSVSPVTWRGELCIVCLGKWVEGGGRWNKEAGSGAPSAVKE